MDDGGIEVGLFFGNCFQKGIFQGPCTLESCRNERENLKLLLKRTKQQSADLQKYSKIQAENETIRMKLVAMEDTLRIWTNKATEAMNAKELAEAELKQIQSTTEYYRKKVAMLQEQADESEKHKEQANHWRDKYDSICALTEKLESNNIEIKQKYEASVKTMETVGKKMLSHQETIKVLRAEKTENGQKQRKLDKYLKSAIQVIDSLSQSTNLNRQPKEIQDLIKVFRRDDIRLFFNSEQYKNDAQPSTSQAPDPDEAGPAPPPPPARRGAERTLSDDEDVEDEEEDVDEDTDEEVDREVRKLEKFVINQSHRARKRADFEPKMLELKARKGAPRLLKAKDIPAKNWPAGIKKPDAKDHGWLVNPQTTHSKTVPTSDFDAIATATEARKRALLGANGAAATSSGSGTTIHGKKGKTVREQQQDMMKGETVKQRVARMKAEAAGKTSVPSGIPVEEVPLDPQDPQDPKEPEAPEIQNPSTNPPRTRYQSFKLSERGSDSEEEPEPKRRGRPPARATSSRGPSRAPSRAQTPMPTRRSSRLSTMSTESQAPPTPKTRTRSVLPAAATAPRTTRPRSRSTHSNSSTRGERARARSVLRGDQEEEEDATSSAANAPEAVPKAPEEESLGDVVRRRLGMETKKRAAPAPSTSGPPLRTRRMERVKAPVATKKVSEKVPEKVPEEVSEKVPEKVTEKVPEKVPEKVTENAPEEVPEAPESTSMDFGNISSSSDEKEARAPAGAEPAEEPMEEEESSSDSDDSVILRPRPAYNYNDDNFHFAPDDPEIMAARASRFGAGSPELVQLDDSMEEEEPKELVVGVEEDEEVEDEPETAPVLTQKSSEEIEELMVPKEVPEAPKSSKSAPEQLQAVPDAPKLAPESSKSAPEQLQAAPEALEAPKPVPVPQKAVTSPLKSIEKPKVVQESPTPAEMPESAPESSKMAQEPPKSVNFDSNVPESAPEPPKMAQEPPKPVNFVPKSAPEPPKMAQKLPAKSSETPEKPAQIAPKSAPEPLKLAPESTKPASSTIPIKSPKQMIVCQYGLEISDSEEEEEQELQICEESTSAAPETTVPKLILPPEPSVSQAPPTPVTPTATSSYPEPVKTAPKPAVPQAPPTPVAPTATSSRPEPARTAPPTSLGPKTPPIRKPDPPLSKPKTDNDDLLADILSGARAPPVTKKVPSRPVAPPTSSGPLKRPAPPTSEENPPKRQYTKKEVPIIEAAPLKRARSTSRKPDVPSTSSSVPPATSSGTKGAAPVKTILIDAPTRPRGKNIKMEQKPVGLKEAMAKNAEKGGKRVNKFKTHLRQALDLKLPVHELKRPMEEKGVILDTSIPLSPSDAVDVMMEFLRETAAGDMWAVLNRQRLDMNLTPMMNTEEQNFLQVGVSLNEQDQKVLELFIGRILYEVSVRDSIDSKQCGRLVRLFCHALHFAKQISCLEDLDEEDDREVILHQQKSTWMRQLFMVLFHKHPTQLMKSLAYCLISDVSEHCRFVVDELEKDQMSSEFQFAFRILLHKDSEQAGIINWLLGAKFQMAYVIHLSSEEITMACDLAHRRFIEDHGATLKSSIFLAKSGAPEVLSVAFRLLQDQMRLVKRQFLEPKDKEKELKHKTVFSVPTITTKMNANDAVAFRKEAEWQKTVLLVLIDNPTSRHYVEIMKALTTISVEVVAFREIVESSDVENFVDQSGVDALREALQHFLDLISEFTNFPLKPSTLPGAGDPSVPSTSNQD
ncbi:hypothetical protein CAEBREN_11701 [Caenorhabditis brenneri]|uniref:Uncharacterized protein n=1 Tax=Caenorhabditis brenneri TaxID=135651 RepID=G0P6G7_CAEBE|nr:hypothetical protein CAEBREN_11701 [Caenorhabditis brenneri]